ncbi:DEAD/DEAH box helicase [Streptomyces sp. PR69]|uniref:DEAD/DEAH box helicase n=1 Tax=Streptomyces sp. PR69 TaxID=2984950 RepID=UPI00226559A2|nr:DEAD/DEAH box helicase [Streptomyces sp. PR69]
MARSGASRDGVAVGRQGRAVLAAGERLLGAARAVVGDHAHAVGAVRAVLGPMVEELSAHELEAIPVARLRDVTEGRLRLNAIETAGYTSVRQVLRANRYQLRQIPGVGAQTADQALAAARQIADAVAETVAVRIDPDRPEPCTTELVIALHRLVEAGPGARRAVDAGASLAERLGPLIARGKPVGGRLRMWLAGREKREEALAAAADLRDVVDEAEEGGVPVLLAQTSADLLRGPAAEAEAWVDFELRSAEYYSLLAEISGTGPDVAAAEGFLPGELADRVRRQPLDDTYRRVSLRGYQSFGARFALTQRRVVLGDEMGLGKTVQAIAAMAHLAAEGQSRFLVVCPASVLINWTREIRARSALSAVPLHGVERQDAFAEWRERGGVGVTTYDALRGFPLPAEGELGMLVVDEAHYVKNPEALRSRSVARWAGLCERVLFLTGTPMENRVAEFRSLVSHLQPGLVARFGEAEGVAGSQAFRRAVAPAYLRRNQTDVLAELPSLVRVDEWEEPSAADDEAYRAAVMAGNFMAMRRAAYERPRTSAKLQRLVELVAEAADNGLKVVVFSYFRDVLDTVHTALAAKARDSKAPGSEAPGSKARGSQAPGSEVRGSEAPGSEVLGPLSGSLPPARRQQLVDEFGAVRGHAVLLAQIEAGGVGLNLQAASVVIICEPQVKPTIEHQAVARAHRMGQVRSVQVHRLLSTTGVDRRLCEILESKSRLFDAYARRSEVAEATPDAVDVSDGALARRIVEEEQERLAARSGPRAETPAP